MLIPNRKPKSLQNAPKKPNAATNPVSNNPIWDIRYLHKPQDVLSRRESALIHLSYEQEVRRLKQKIHYYSDHTIAATRPWQHSDKIHSDPPTIQSWHHRLTTEPGRLPMPRLSIQSIQTPTDLLDNDSLFIPGHQ